MRSILICLFFLSCKLCIILVVVGQRVLSIKIRFIFVFSGKVQADSLDDDSYYDLMAQDYVCENHGLVHNYHRIDVERAVYYFEKYVYPPREILLTTYQQASKYLAKKVRDKDNNFNPFIFVFTLTISFCEDLFYLASNPDKDQLFIYDLMNMTAHFKQQIAGDDIVDIQEQLFWSGVFSLQLAHDLICTSLADIVDASKNQVHQYEEHSLDEAYAYVAMRAFGILTRHYFYQSPVQFESMVSTSFLFLTESSNFMSRQMAVATKWLVRTTMQPLDYEDFGSMVQTMKYLAEELQDFNSQLGIDNCETLQQADEHVRVLLNELGI